MDHYQVITFFLILQSTTINTASQTATCEIFGDPHYVTFDQLRYSPQGSCRYIAVQTRQDMLTGSQPQFKIIAKHYDMKAEENAERGIQPLVTFLQYLEFQLGDATIRLPERDMRHALYNGAPIRVPAAISINESQINLYPNSRGVELSTEFGVTVTMIHGAITNSGRVTLNSTYYQKVNGICGTYDGQRNNDLVTAEGKWNSHLTKAARESAVANSYIAPDSNIGNLKCPDMPPTPEIYCEDEIKDSLGEKNHCGYTQNFTDSPFRHCLLSGQVHYDGVEESCYHDVCHAHLIDWSLPEGCFKAGKCSIDFQLAQRVSCTGKGILAFTCQRFGLNVTGWRSYFGCPLECPDKMHYVTETSNCPPTCADVLNLGVDCTDDGIQTDGCVCDDGLVLNDDYCIKPTECGCVYNSTEPKVTQHLPVDKVLLSLDCTQEITCQYNSTSNRSKLITDNWILLLGSECNGLGQVVCSSGTFKDENGWCSRCFPGFFLPLSANECIACPLGQYSEEPGASSCASCPPYTTTEGVNSTSLVQCFPDALGVCRINRGTHYYTYDGEMINLRGGVCKYLASTNQCDDNSTALYHFDVFIKQENRSGCCSDFASGVSFIQYIEVNVSGRIFKLQKPGSFELNDMELSVPYTSYIDSTVSGSNAVNVTITQQNDGILLVTSYGLEVWFDGNWLATITVPRQIFVGKLCGLCGNWDGNARNDLMSRDGRNVADLNQSEAHAEIGNSFIVLTSPDDGGVCPLAKPVDVFRCEGGNLTAERVVTEEFCGFDAQLIGNPFLPCIISRRIGNGSDLLKNACVQDVCEHWYGCLEEGGCTYETSKEIACSLMSVVSDTCISAGQVTIGWRGFFNCPATSTTQPIATTTTLKLPTATTTAVGHTSTPRPFVHATSTTQPIATATTTISTTLKLPTATTTVVNHTIAMLSSVHGLYLSRLLLLLRLLVSILI